MCRRADMYVLSTLLACTCNHGLHFGLCYRCCTLSISMHVPLYQVMLPQERAVRSSFHLRCRAFSLILSRKMRRELPIGLHSFT